MTTKLIAIDPGSTTGAAAIFTDEEDPVIFVGDLPSVYGQIDAAYLARLFHDMRPKAVVVERVHSMPKQGVASTFKFGVAYGIIQGVVTGAGIPLHLVVPGVWKKHFKLIGQDKDAARALAIRLYPGMRGLELKKHVGRADALLLGRYFLEEGK